MSEDQEPPQQPRDPTRILTAAALGVALLFAAVVVVIYMLGTSPGSSSPAAPSGDEAPFGGTPLPDVAGMPTPLPDTGVLSPFRPEVGSPAPDFALIDVRDSTLIRHLSDHSGTPVVLNWYASWCGPCEDELPDFQAAQDALGDDIAFFAVNYIESQDDAVRLLDRYNITFPAVMDTSGEVSEHYRVRGLPTTMLIDADGIVRVIHYGPLFGPDLERELTKIGIDYQAPR